MPVYYMSISPLPKKTTTELTSLMRKFLWGTVTKKRYLALITWATVCQDKQAGGLGIRDLQKMNDALILKLVWNFMVCSCWDS
jgi:hypothetical protein